MPRLSTVIAITWAALPAAGWADHVAQASHGMVASSQTLASQAGVQIMKEGGNAVDAACAVALALAVVHPAAGNLGGGGFMLIRMADGRAVAIDYREAAPAAATETMYQDVQGNILPGASLVGYRASGVPGTVAGLSLAHQKFGKLPWAAVVKPAIDLASDGFTLSDGLARELKSSRNLAKFPESRRIFQRNGDFYRAAETFKQPELAATLERLANQGPSDFYRGKTAALIADAMKQNGLITRQDLAGYRAVVRKPLVGSYHGYQVVTMPPPSSGGVALLEALNLLSGFDLDSSGFDTAKTDHLLVESMRRAFADRSKYLGDPDFVKVPVSGLTSPRYADKLRATISDSQASPSDTNGPGDPTPYESSETTHFSVVDAQGNAVSNTYTLNFGFGSGVTIPGAGFLMNDEMDDFTSKPGVPNGFGLIQGAANAIQPHKRPLSSMTPTILVKNGKPILVLGSPGGPTIITSVLQVVVNVVDHGMILQEAVAAPRIHHQWLPDAIDVEEGAIPQAVREVLTRNGYRFSDGEGRHWGDVEAIAIDPQTALRIGVSDPRSGDAGAAGY